ncbi:MAG: prephenate dehydratase domain-containing protein, partial [Pirellula staleyi]
MTEKNSFFTRSAEEIDLIEKLREIDAKILELAKQRCALLSQSSLEAQKEGHGFASLREMQSLQSDRSEGDFGSRLLRYVSGLTYQTAVMRQSIAYLGPEFSYSYSATAKYFGAIDGLQAVSSIGAVFEEIERGHAKYGVVPIENSTDGRIVDTLNMFIKTPLR